MNLTVDVLRYALDALGRAEKVAAGNVANDQTPGYVARTYDFESSLRAALASGTPTSLSASEGYSSAPAGTDGNNVSITGELVGLSGDQLQTQAVANALGAQFQILADSMAASAGGTL